MILCPCDSSSLFHHQGASCLYWVQDSGPCSECLLSEEKNIHVTIGGATYFFLSTTSLDTKNELDLMLMKHYAPNRCLYIKVAKLRTGVGSAETSYLQNCSVKLFKEHFKVQICKGRLFEKQNKTFFLIFTN